MLGVLGGGGGEEAGADGRERRGHGCGDAGGGRAVLSFPRARCDGSIEVWLVGLRREEIRGRADERKRASWCGAPVRSRECGGTDTATRRAGEARRDVAFTRAANQPFGFGFRRFPGKNDGFWWCLDARGRTLLRTVPRCGAAGAGADHVSRAERLVARLGGRLGVRRACRRSAGPTRAGRAYPVLGPYDPFKTIRAMGHPTHCHVET